jgi:dTDP-4-amino-4,6-dideoxygalactose transaminase
MTDKLAILGGTPAIGPGVTFHMWPATDARDEALVLESLRQDKHAYGPHVQALEREFAAWNGNAHCMATNSGTSALHMCVAACGVEAGDEVITTALSWTSSATAIIHHSAVPVFVDVDWASMHLDPAQIESVICDRTRAILVVHYWGVSVDMDPILDIARRHGLAVIEDACQAHGATYKGRRVGTIGDVAAFSLNQNKNLCGGEGGLFVTNNAEMFRRGRAVAAFSDMRPSYAGRDYDDYGLGWMYRTSDLPAAFALSQLRRVDETNAQALANWHMLLDLLDGTPHLVPPFSTPDRPTNGYAYVWRVDPAYAQERGVNLRRLTEGIVAALRAEGVAMSQANWMLPAHSVFQAKNAFGHGAPWTYARSEVSYDLDQYPVTQDCVDTCLWNVNTHRPPNGEAQVRALAAAVRKVFERLDDVPVAP